MDEPAEHGNSPAPCRKKARVADIGDGHLRAVNEAAAGLAVIRQLEADESAAMALAQVRLRPLAAGWLFGPEISD